MTVGQVLVIVAPALGVAFAAGFVACLGLLGTAPRSAKTDPRGERA